LDYNDLALFARVVEHGSFTSAAKAMGLPKSSVTRGIARLEKGLGVRLIQRTTRQRGVTDAGRELYERVRGAVGALEEAAEAVREQGKAPRGIVRVTANPDAAMMGVPQMLVELRAKLPSIHVGTPKKLADLADHDCVLFRGRNGRATWQFEQPKSASIEVEGVASIDDFWFMSRALGAGLGIGPIPIFIAANDPDLERVLTDHTMSGAPLSLVMPSAAYVPARVAAVRDFLHAKLTAVMNSCDQR